MPFHNFRVMDNLKYVVLSILFANLMLPAWAQGIYVLEKDNKFFEVGQRKSFVDVDDDSCRQLRSLLKYGFINPNGEVVVPFRYDEAKSFSEGLAAVRVGSKWGFLDKKGRIVIEPKFDSVDFFREGLAAVRVKQQFGFIDMRGNIVVKPQFDCALHFSCGRAAVLVGHKCGFIDRKGRMVIAPNYDYVVPFSEGLAAIKIGEKFGYIDTDGKIVIQPKFDFAESFSHSRALVASSKEHHFLYLDARGISQAWCPHHTDDWVDFTECVTAPHREDDTYAAWSSSAPDDAKYGFIDKHGKCVIPMVYGHAQSFSDGLALVEDFPMRNYGYIDTTGKFRIQMRSGHGQPFSEGLAVVMPSSAFELNPSSDVQSSVIDGQGKVRHFSPGHFFCVRFSSGLTAFGSDDGLYGFYRTNLKIGIAPTYDKAENFSEGLAVVAVADLHKISSNESARKAYKLGLRAGPPSPSSPADEIAAFSRAIEADPSCGAAVFERAKKFVEAGKEAEAITDFARSIELGYKPVESSIRAARIQRERFRAIENFNKCLQLCPEFVSILIARGQLHAALGDNESAVSDLTKAIGIHEQRYGLPRVGDKKCKFEVFESFPDYEKQTKESSSQLANSATGIELQPSSNERKLCCKYSLLDAITIRAQSLMSLGRLDEAAKDYNHVCALAPSESRREAVNFRKDCLLQMRRYDLAEKDLTELLASEPYMPHLLRERAYTYLKMGRFVDVVRDCDAFLEDQPNCGRSLYLRSQAYFHLNNLRRASQDLAQARQLGYLP